MKYLPHALLIAAVIAVFLWAMHLGKQGCELKQSQSINKGVKDRVQTEHRIRQKPTPDLDAALRAEWLR